MIQVLSNFGSTKAELNLRYRLGLEHALSKADFMSSPNLVLVQAFTIFLFLARLHDKPMSVWMMTGLVIRMAHAIGLHRDGSHFAHLSPFEVEMRRRVWWAVCMLDTRASEDQGTDYSITAGTYDTKLPLNINDADIDPETKEPPPERQALTDMTISLVTHEMCGKARQMTGREAKEGAANLDERSRAITALFEHLQILYLQYATESGNIACWVAVTATRLVMCKLTLYVYLPSLFSSPNESFSEEIRNKLLVAAIELAEYNHILNSERNARHWRWTFQTYTHWHAIVYLLIECSRRQWSPTLERAWIALHSHWLIPKKSPSMDRKSQIWVPLRKLMAKARKHRTAELKRLRGNMQAVEQLEMADINIPAPESSMTFSTENSRDLSLRHWRSLVNVSADQGTAGLTAGPGDPRISNSLSVRESIHTPPQHPGFVLSVGKPRSWPNASFESGYPNTGSYVGGNSLANASVNPNAIMGTNSQSALEGKPADPAEWPLMDPGSSGWLWADTDPMVDVFGDVDVDINMDIAGDIDWNSWVQSAAGMEMNACPPGSNGGVYERQYLI